MFKYIITLFTGIVFFANSSSSSEDLVSGTNAEFIYHIGDKGISDPLTQESIYKISNTFRFPMNQSPSVAQSISTLSKEDKEMLNKYEYTFIKNKLKDENINIEMYRIPKSLYQLLVVKYFFDPVILKKQNHKDIDLHSSKFTTSFSLNQHHFTHNDFYKIYEDHMYNKDLNGIAGVKNGIPGLFWEINQYIVDFIETTKKDFYICDLSTTGNIKNFINATTKSLAYGIYNLSRDQNGDILYHGYRRQSYFFQTLSRGNTRDIGVFLDEISGYLLNEYETMNTPKYFGTTRLYRGGGDFNITKNNSNLISLSNGIFAGIINDSYSGNALDVMYKTKKSFGYFDFKQSSKNIFIPPIDNLTSTLASGEFHHPRVKVDKDYESKVIGIDYDNTIKTIIVSPKDTPFLFTDIDNLENFYFRRFN